MEPTGRTRRQFVVGATVATALGLAGCTGEGDSPSDSDDGDASGDGNTSGDDHQSDDHTGGDSHGSEIEGPKPSATVSMATTDDGTHFEPHVVWVEQGGTVTWELESGTHTATAYSADADRPDRLPDGASGWDSGTLSDAGATFEHTFETAGVYDYFCRPHEASGMLGSVIVGEPSPDGQPGLQPPQDDLPDEAATKIESLNQRVQSALGGGGDEGEDGGHSHDGTTTESDGNSSTHGGNETSHSDGEDH